MRQWIKTNRNVIANYLSRFWAGVSTFLFVPFYLYLLGPEAFGLISFNTAILGMAFILDVGMSNAFAREMARVRDPADLGDLLRSLEMVYLAIVSAVAILAVSIAGFIADHWFNPVELTSQVLRWSIGLMMVSAILQVMMALYVGGLLGSNRHVTAAVYQIGFGVVRSALVFVPLWFVREVELVFAWQLAASIGCLFLLRRTVWRVIRGKEPDGTRPARFSKSALNDIRSFASGMFGIAVISAINTQSDKLIVSKIFSLDQLGMYSIASLIAQIPAMLALPLAITVLPQLTAAIANAEQGPLHSRYMRFSFLIAAVSGASTMGVIVGAPHILALLTHAEPANELVAVCRLLVLGGWLLAAQYMPYHLAIASGHTRTSFILGVVSAILMPLTMYVGATSIGLIGAAVPWLVINAVTAALLCVRITPRFLGPHLTEWLLKGNVLPLAVCVATICPLLPLLPGIASPLTGLILLGAVCGLAIAINALIFNSLFRDDTKLSPPISGNADAS